MKLYKIVLKDVLRRKRRIFYAALGVLVGTMTAIGILTVSRAGEASVYNQLEKYGANLTIVPAVSSVDMKLGNLNLGSLGVGENYIAQNTLPEIQTISDAKIREYLKIEAEGNIAIVAPKLYANAQIGETTAMAVGIFPDEEMVVKTWWRIREGGYISGADTAIVGSVAAEVLGLNTGDRVAMNGTEVTVVGILDQTGANDDYQIFVPLGTLQAAFGKEGLVSSVDVRALCNGCPVEIIADTINGSIPGVRAVAVKQVAAAEMGIVERIRGFMLALAGITLLVGALGVVNTMIASVHERIRDIGIMKAVGASHRQIIKVFIYEAIIIGLVGGVLGYLLGTLLAYGIGPLVFEGAPVTYVLVYLPLALVVAVVLAVLSAAYPAYRATRVKVVECFRST